IAKYDASKVQSLLENTNIIRNRAKITATIANAQRIDSVIKEFGSFSDYIWQFVGGRPIQNNWTLDSDVPTKTVEAEAMSNDLKKRGFKFVGPTICYAFMQAAGLVNDHTIS